jgi:O-antigen/teichoic acid export membrane protein
VRRLVRAYRANGALIPLAGSLFGTMVATSGLGFVFWWVAARLFPPRSLGIAGAAVSAMMLLSSIGLMGMGSVLIRDLPRHRGREPSLILSGLFVAGGVSAGLAVLFALISPLISADLGVLAAGPGPILLFAFGTAITAVGVVLDRALIGMLMAPAQLIRNTIMSIAKLAILPAAALFAFSGLEIFAAWTVGTVLSMLALAAWGLMRMGRRLLAAPDWSILGGLTGAAWWHHVLNLTLQAPTWVMPLVVTAVASAETNAAFYVALLLVSFIWYVPGVFEVSLFAVGSQTRGIVPRDLRLSLGVSTAAALLSIAGTVLLGDRVLAFFHPAFAAQAATALVIMSIGSLPLVIKNHYVAIHRVHFQERSAALVSMLTVLLEAGLATAGLVAGGLTGLAIGWLVAMSFEAAAMSPAVIREFNHPGDLLSRGAPSPGSGIPAAADQQ